MEIHLVECKDPFEDKDWLGERETWKAGLIDVLKNSPSKGRKFLRWNITEICQDPSDSSYFRKFVEAGELEVLP